MRYNIIESIDINEDKAIVEIIRKEKDKETVIDKQDMTELLQANGEIQFYSLIIKQVLSNSVTFSQNGNQTVRKLKKVYDHLLLDEKYKNKKENVNKILSNIYKFKDVNKERIKYERQLDKAYNDLNNYIISEVLHTIYPELKVITLPNQMEESKMNIQFYKQLLDELLEVNKISDITDEQKEKFFEKYDLLTKDFYHYYELTLNSQNQSGIIFLKEKYPNNFIISELLDSKIKYIDLRMKEYEDRYWGLCSVFTAFYGADNYDVKQEIEAMTNKERRGKFVEKNYKEIADCEEKYLKLVEEYKQKLYEKQDNEI